MRRATILFAFTAIGCFSHAETPRYPANDASAGRAPPVFNRERACAHWSEIMQPLDESAMSHVSFPELDPRACYVQVHQEDGGAAHADETPAGCGFPQSSTASPELERSAARYAAVAEGSVADLPVPLACSLPADVRIAAAKVNARTLQRLARSASSARQTPYSAVATFGFGHPVQGDSALLPWRPGDRCPALSKREMDKFGINIVRAGRAAAARNGHVAPVVILSGGAVHSPLYEAFMLDYLVTCRFGVRADAVLLDPCADHTHTNLKNTGALVVELGGRTAYVVTDDGLQGVYLQEWTSFDLIGGSIDQRSLRDFGHLLGAYRQASIGIRGGFWFTPYRFWAEPVSGAGGFQCDE